MNPAPGRGRRTKWLELAAIGFLTVAIIALGYFAFHETIGLFAGSDTPGHPDLAPPRMIGPADPAAPRPRKAEAITAMPQPIVLPGMTTVANPVTPRAGGPGTPAPSLVSTPSVVHSIAIASINKGIVAPPLEIERERKEKNASLSTGSDVTVETGFDASPNPLISSF